MKFVLIDYENVTLENIELLDKENFNIIVFVGEFQTRIRTDTVMALQRMGNRATYIKITGNGSNALDFHIAYYIGEISVNNPKASFHIISKDKGFDPLIKHLKERISIVRNNNILEVLDNVFHNDTCEAMDEFSISACSTPLRSLSR